MTYDRTREDIGVQAHRLMCMLAIAYDVSSTRGRDDEIENGLCYVLSDALVAARELHAAIDGAAKIARGAKKGASNAARTG